MSFSFKNGRALITDPVTGAIVFDSNQKMFTGVLYEGVKNVPARTHADSERALSLDIDENDRLRSIPDEFDTVVGAFKVTTSGDFGVANIGWFQAGGTYVHYWDGVGRNNRPSENATLAHCAAYTFYADNGGLWFNERVLLIADTGRKITINPIRFDYRLYAGTFI